MLSLFPKRDCVIQRVPCWTGAAATVTKREGRKVDQSRLADTARVDTTERDSRYERSRCSVGCAERLPRRIQRVKDVTLVRCC